jgi:hypothetical protein
MLKFQIPSSKLQRNFKPQASMTNEPCGGGLEFGHWSFSGCWCLGFGALKKSAFRHTISPASRKTSSHRDSEIQK